MDEVLAIARKGAAYGCKEALFTLGDKPELRYADARAWLDAMGHATTIDYVVVKIPRFAFEKSYSLRISALHMPLFHQGWHVARI